jgi:cytidine deaminase
VKPARRAALEATTLVELAREARRLAYAPYSKFLVGAALLSRDGRIFTGCNVENASYGGTICAERTALVKAVSEGCREFTAIAVVSARRPPVTPCGICRQVLAEFARDMAVHVAGAKGPHATLRLASLLPHSFRL